MEKIKLYISIMSLLFGVIMFIVGLVAKLGKGKGKEVAEKILGEQDKIRKLITDVIPKAVENAEEQEGCNGGTKKTIALSTIMLECAKMGIDYIPNIGLIETQLEKLIAFSKKVN